MIINFIHVNWTASFISLVVATGRLELIKHVAKLYRAIAGKQWNSYNSYPLLNVLVRLFCKYGYCLYNEMCTNNLLRLADSCTCQGTGSSALLARFIGLTWGPSGADRTQVGPMLAPWTLLSGSVSGNGMTYVWNQWWPGGELTNIVATVIIFEM